ncbi:MAG: hypothetical protein FJX60_17755 [Alphaproteobacteria bacterium]|nr:hypothetical protein [Alphaproteobacteria bacterium]
MDAAGMDAEISAEPRARGFGAPSAEAPDDQANVTPEEQAQYTAFVENALRLYYGDKTGGRLQATLKALSASGDPVQDLAATAATIVQRVEDSAKDRKVPLAEGVVFHAGAEILEDLAELAEKAGIHTFSEEEVEKAGYRAIDLYRAARGDEIDEDRAGADLAEMMNQDPALAEMVAGLSQQMGKPVPQAPSRNPATGAQEFYDDMTEGAVDNLNTGLDDGKDDTKGGGWGDALSRAIESVGDWINDKMNAENLGGTIIGAMAGPAGFIAGPVVNAIGRANQLQFDKAVTEGRADRATGRGYDKGLFGERVEIALGPGPINDSSGHGSTIDLEPDEPLLRRKFAEVADLSANYRLPETAAGAMARAPVARGFGRRRV